MYRTFIKIIVTSCLMMACNQEVKKTLDNNSLEQTGEQHRPKFHFTPKTNWMNDPNGMFYYDGKYHLFYQHYPDSTVWGPMHWAHAESKDLIKWEHLPIGLYPDSIGCIFSGGAVVDKNNTSQLGTLENPPIIAAFTHHNFEGEKAKTNDFQKQSLAYSVDGGYEWTKFKGNPVIPNTEKIKDFRDPKVVWHEASQKWILVLAAYDRVKFYASSNHIDWEFISDFGIEGDDRLWECPDLFPMKVEGSDELKWVLIVSIQRKAPNGGTATSYFVGDFDGHKFESEVEDQKWLDWGTDNYAFVTWNNVPETDGRILGIGWMSNWQYAQIVPTENWRSAMTLPRELSLVKSNSVYTLQSLPVREFRALRKEQIVFEDLVVAEEKELDGSFSAAQVELEMTINLKETTTNTFGIKISNDLNEKFVIEFNKSEGNMKVDRTNSSNNKFSEEFFKSIHTAPINFEKDTMNIRVIFDVASAEIFLDNGALSFTSIFFPSEDFSKLSLFSRDGALKLSSLKVNSLSTAWD